MVFSSGLVNKIENRFVLDSSCKWESLEIGTGVLGDDEGEFFFIFSHEPHII
jgi:hypothetical protein